MLTLPEKFLFIVAVAAALYYGARGFLKVYNVIRRGQGETVPRAEMIERGVNALVTWLTIRPIWQTRTVASVFHAMIAWGFVFYFLVNFGDVLEGFFPITFLGEGFIGSIYRFLADIFTVLVLVGMVFFLLRRFLYDDKALDYRENVKLLDKVRTARSAAIRSSSASSFSSTLAFGCLAKVSRSPSTVAGPIRPLLRALVSCGAG